MFLQWCGWGNQFFWDVTCHYTVLKRRELNAQQRRMTSSKNLNTSKVKMFDQCLCETATGCNKIMAKQICVFRLSIFLSTVKCPLYLALSPTHYITKCYSTTVTQTADTNVLFIIWKMGRGFIIMHKVLLYIPEYWRLWRWGWVTLYLGNTIVWLVENCLGFNTKNCFSTWWVKLKTMHNYPLTILA